jgi:histidine ammonia-lyase
MSFLAYRKAVAAGRCLDGALAALAAVASQALHGAGRGAGPALDPVLAQVREHFPPVTGEPRQLGLDADALMDAFGARVLGRAG